jgi:hypothetical protein
MHVLLRRGRFGTLGDIPRAGRLAAHILLFSEQRIIVHPFAAVIEARALQSLLERQERIVLARAGHGQRLNAGAERGLAGGAVMTGAR